MRTRQTLAVATAILIGGGAVVAATTSKSDDTAARFNEVGAEIGDDDAAPQTAARSAAGAGSNTAGGASVAADQAESAPVAGRVPDAQPRVVKTAQLELTMGSDASVTKATERADSVAAAHGGFVATSETQRGEGRHTSLTLRLPVATFDAALTDLRRLGKVTNESLGGKDVTSTLVDLDARLRTLRAQEEALNALVAKARTVGETLEVAREAANVRMQVEQLAAQQAQLADQADFATITVQILGPGVSVVQEPDPQPLLVNSFERALGGSLAVLGGTLILLGYLLPLVVVGGAGYGLWRLVRGRRPEGQNDGQPAVV